MSTSDVMQPLHHEQPKRYTHWPGLRFEIRRGEQGAHRHMPRSHPSAQNGNALRTAMDLASLIERATHQAPPPPSEQRWLERREAWLRQLEQLSCQVHDWLTAAGVPKAAFQPYQEARNEEWIGSYLVEGWLVDIGTFRLRFDPRGTLMVGACGRVDLKSSQAGSPVVSLIAQAGEHDDTSWKWSIYCDEAGMEDLELTQENLAQALSLLMPAS